MVELSVTEALADLLRKKNADYMSVTKSSLPDSLKKRLGLTKDPTASQIEKAVSPHQGGPLRLKRGSRKRLYLAGKPDEDLLFGIVQKREGKSPSADNTPFTKDEYADVMNRLLEQGRVRVELGLDSKKNFVPRLSTAEPSGSPDLEDKFKAAYQSLERGKFHVRICEMRRRLGWDARAFDAMLARLRDAGKIQLQTGDTDYFSEDDIRDSFTDENGFTKLTMKWRPR